MSPVRSTRAGLLSGAPQPLGVTPTLPQSARFVYSWGMTLAGILITTAVAVLASIGLGFQIHDGWKDQP